MSTEMQEINHNKHIVKTPVIEKLKDIMVNEEAIAQQELDTMYKYYVALKQYEPEPQLTVVKELPQKEKRVADHYYWVDDKNTKELYYCDIHKNAVEIALGAKQQQLLNNMNSLSKTLTKNLKNLENCAAEYGDVYTLNAKNMKTLFQNTGLKNPRIAITKDLQDWFETVYYRIHLKLYQNPLKLNGYKVILQQMNSIANKILINNTEALALDLVNLTNAIDQFGANNLAGNEHENAEKSVIPHKVKVALAAFIGGLIGFLVGAGVATLTTFLTIGFGAPAGILAGVLAGSAVGGAVTGALIGYGCGRARQSFFKKKADKENKVIQNHNDQYRTLTASQAVVEAVNHVKEEAVKFTI